MKELTEKVRFLNSRNAARKISELPFFFPGRDETISNINFGIAAV
jgi:hypothetical protein